MTAFANKLAAAIVKEEFHEMEHASKEKSNGHTATSVEASPSPFSPSPPPRSSSWTYWAMNNATWVAEQLLCLLDGSKFKTKAYLSGNFSPVHDEVFQPGLTVLEGALPVDLKGAFVRTGPNPYYKPLGGYHWFDGDGMAHAVRISDASATYCNRFINTAKLQEEKAAGYPVCGKFGDCKGIFGLFHILSAMLRRRLGLFSSDCGLGTANTALLYHAGKLMSLHEGDLPYHLRIACDGLLSTVERVTFNGQLLAAPANSASGKEGGTRPAVLTAHPKVDPQTGEMFAFGYSVEQAPYLWFTRVSATGEIEADFPVPGLRGPIMMHDFALTERHVIFVDAPLFFKPDMMLKKGSLPFEFDRSAPLRLGVMDRYAPNADAPGAVQWFSLEPQMCFHVANAWESPQNPNQIHVYLCAFKDFSLDEFTAVSADSEPRLTRVVLDLETGQAATERLIEEAGDFPVVPATLVGRPARYSYVATFTTSPAGAPQFYGVAKVDLTAAAGSKGALTGLIHHGEGRLGGECYFVPRKGGKEEDDGYLMTYVYDDGKIESELVIYDAKTMSEKPVARIGLGLRVPFGFHCTWVTEEQIKGQK